MIGIYMIQCKLNNKIYIGSSKDVLNRLKCHKYSLNNYKHNNKYLQNDWNKYKEENFIFKLIEKCNVYNLLEREQYYIEFYLSVQREYGYNILCNQKCLENIQEKLNKVKNHI